MSSSLQRLATVELPELSTTIRNAGVAGAGGAGFPTHAKWDRLGDVDNLLVNHQESEPNYYIDKWLGRTRADELASLFDALLDRGAFETIVVGAKEKDRERWMGELEEAMNPTVYTPEDLPLDPDEESGVVFAYTEDRYEYGMESVILRMIAGVVVGDDLPMDHGWIVQNTETMHAIYRTLDEGRPMTAKYVHVDGNVPEHRFLEVPVGTPASTLLEAAGRPPADLSDDEVLADGGPGWCFEIETDPESFGVRKRTNCVLVLDRDEVEENTLGEDRINVRGPREWAGDHEREPTRVVPEYVRVPLITNPAFEGVVDRSEPLVEPGTTVEAGEMIATPGSGGVSNTQHAPVDGEVTSVSEDAIEIRTDEERVTAVGERTDESLVYWTWCTECGTYVVPPKEQTAPGLTDYVCEDCR